jgi:hypothetical protein
MHRLRSNRYSAIEAQKQEDLRFGIQAVATIPLLGITRPIPPDADENLH